MPTRTALAVIALSLLLAAGCSPAKLNESKTYTLAPGDAQSLDLPAISSPQTVTVEFTSSVSDVSVLLFRETDAQGNEGLNGSDPKLALAQKKGKEGGFAADVPAKTATRLIVRGANVKTEVTLKVTNAK